MASGTLSRFAALSPEARAKELADRGKDTERAVEKHLAELAKRATFSWERYPDAKAGSMKEALADYLIVKDGRLTLLEAKEVHHTSRLPHGNFKVSQVARMRRFKLAGARAFVLVQFQPEGLWRAADIDYFAHRSGGSWDMRAIEPKPMADWIQLYA